MEENLEFATDDEITDADEVSVEEAIEAAAKADVIPFPNSDENAKTDDAVAETPSPAPSPAPETNEAVDSNKQLSPDEIAALFAQAA
ncbi:MAG: hypothetical protein K2H07_06400, partial [Lachnospiraceae bacterium]|nr:hypothetical protein [Lachnospiraceae bacterium]